MGRFLDRPITTQTNSSYNVGFNKGYNTNNYGNVNFGQLLISSLPQLLAKGFDYLEESDNADGNNSVKANNKKEIKDLKKQKEEILKPYNNSEDELNTKITRTESEVNNLKSEIDTAKSNLAAIGGSSTAIEADMNKYYDASGNLKDEYYKIDANGNKTQTVTPPKTFDEYKQAIQVAKDLEKDIANKTTDLNTKSNEVAQLQTVKGQVENINNRLLELQGSKNDSDFGYNVKEEVSDIKSFKSALDAYKDTPNVQNANKLKELADKIDNVTVKKAWDAIKDQVNATITSPKTAA